MKQPEHSAHSTVAAGSQSLLTATPAELHLEQFIKHCITCNLKGRQLISEAEAQKINLTYSSLISKINAYKKRGLSAIVRKQRHDADTPRSFSKEVLLTLIDKFTEYQTAIRAYEETHKSLRMNAIIFIPSIKSPFEGGKLAEHDAPAQGDESYKIKDLILYKVLSGAEGQGSIITESTPALFTQGAYVTNDGEEILIGSLKSAQRFLKELRRTSGDQLFFKRYGLANYRLKRQQKMRIDYSHMQPNASWSLDNKLIDVYVMSDDLRRIYRPWLSGVYDAVTRRYCFELSSRPYSEAVVNAIEIAVNKWGKPDEIVEDSGKDYLSHRVKNLLQSLAVSIRVCGVKKANSKMIESFHNIIDQHTKSWPGYCGNKYQLMPDCTKQLLKKFTKVTNIRRLYDNIEDKEQFITLTGNLSARALASKNRFMTETELLERINSALNEYEHTVQGGLKADKLGRKVYSLNCSDEAVNSFGEKLNTPAGRYEYHLAHGFKPVTVDPTVLSLLAMDTAVRVVSTQGIQFGNMQNSGEIEKYFSPKLKNVIGRRVIIKFTRANNRYVYVLSSDELQNVKDTAALRRMAPEAKGRLMEKLKFICIAERTEAISYNDSQYKDILRRQREEEKMLRISSLSGAEGGIKHLTGHESNILPIHEEVAELMQKKNPKKTKYSDTGDY